MPQFEDGATALAIPATSGEVTGSFKGEYLGFTARETGGTNPVTIVLFDNATAASGPILEEINLGAGQSSGDNYPRPGRKVLNGIFASISGTGAVQGSVFQ